MGLNPVPISINLSRLNFYNPNFVKIFKDILDNINLAPEYIQFEITESAILENIDLLNKTIEQLYRLGFKILIDDYMDYYNNERCQWNLKKLTPVQYRNQLLVTS